MCEAEGHLPISESGIAVALKVKLNERRSLKRSVFFSIFTERASFLMRRYAIDGALPHTMEVVSMEEAVVTRKNSSASFSRQHEKRHNEFLIDPR